jgi:hypothetical protein
MAFCCIRGAKRVLLVGMTQPPPEWAPPTSAPHVPAAPERRRVNWFIVGPVIAVVVALAVIGASAVIGGRSKTIDDVRLESKIKTWAVEKQDASPSVKVSCPSGVQIKSGATFHCLLSAGRETARLTVTIENNNGDVTWVVG